MGVARVLSKQRSSTLTLVDQVCSSASNMLLLVLVARATSPEAFGRFAVSFALVTVWLTILRGSVAQVVLLEQGVGYRALRRLALRASVLMVLATVAVGEHAGVSRSLAAMVAGSVLLITLQDLGRYYLMATERRTTALASDAIWLFAVMLIIPAASVWSLSIEALFGLWFLGGCMALVPIARVRIPMDALRPGQWRTITSLGGEVAVLAVVGQLGLFVLAVTRGPSGVASFRGTLVLLSPLVAFAATLPAILTGPALRAGATLPYLALRAKLGVVLIGVTYCGAILLLPDQAGHAVLGGTWDSSRPLLKWAAVAQCLSLLVMVTAVMARAVHGGRTSLLPRSAGATTEALGVIATAPSYGAPAVFASAASAQVVQLILFRARERRRKVTAAAVGAVSAPLT